MGCTPFKCCRPLPFIRKYSTRMKSRKIVLMLVGLDNAGKSSTAKGLAREPAASVVPTVGFASVRLKHRGYSVVIYDLGGGAQIRPIWEQYFVDVHGVMFVVDAGDASRIDESRKVLEQVLCHDKISGKPLLLLANKQDVAGALDELDVVERLDVERLANLYRCPTLVETCRAAAAPRIDPGLLNGYRWLLRRIISDYGELSGRVERDGEEARAAHEAARLRWKESGRAAQGDGDGGRDSTAADITADPFRPISFLVGGGKKKGQANAITCGGDYSRPSTAAAADRTEVIGEPQPLDVVMAVKEQFEQKMRQQKRRLTTLRRANRTVPTSATGCSRFEWVPLQKMDIPTLPRNRPKTAPPAPHPPRRGGWCLEFESDSGAGSSAGASTIVLRSPRSFVRSDNDDDDDQNDDDDVVCAPSQVRMVEAFCHY